MNKLPCTRCPECGLVNQFTEILCECGADLSRCKVVLTDVSSLSPKEYGMIIEDMAAYVQQCSKCGNRAYVVHPRQRKLRCPYCGSDTIAAFRPIYYLDFPET